MRRVSALLLALAAPACREPDLTPVRKDLVASAEAMCAPAPARAPHQTRTRDVTAAEVEGAIVMLCLQAPGADPSADAFATLHEALAQPTPIVGSVRKSRLLLDAPRVDFSKLRATDDGLAHAAGAMADAGAAASCRPSWTVLGRTMIDSAKALARAEKKSEALGRCVDVVALARDEHLDGNLTNAILAQNMLEIAGKECAPIIDGAPKEEAQRVAPILAALRAGFPPTLAPIVRRDRDEMVVMIFAPLRDPAVPFPCPRAEELAHVSGEVQKRGERVALLEAWTESQKADRPLDARYTDEYAKALRVVDDLGARAKGR